MVTAENVRVRVDLLVLPAQALVVRKTRPIVAMSPARVVPTAQKWEFAEEAMQYAREALYGLVTLMRSAESETVRHAAMNSILDRALGKAPQHIDVTALRHTDIVYRSAAELQLEFRKALEAEGVPRALMDLTVEEDETEE
jgi:hypothetical protein